MSSETAESSQSLFLSTKLIVLMLIIPPSIHAMHTLLPTFSELSNLFVNAGLNAEQKYVITSFQDISRNILIDSQFLVSNGNFNSKPLAALTFKLTYPTRLRCWIHHFQTNHLHRALRCHRR